MDYWEKQKLQKSFEQQANIKLQYDFYSEQHLKKTNYDVIKAVFNLKQKVKELIEITGVTEQRATELIYRETNFENAVLRALNQQEIDNKYKKTEKSKTIEENITAFVGYTNVSPDIAQEYLNRSNNDITKALQMQKADKEKKEKENVEHIEQNQEFIETNKQYSQQQGNQRTYNNPNQAYQTHNVELKQFQNSQNQTTTNNNMETNKHKSVRKEPQDLQQSTPPPPERQISPNKQNPVIRPPTPKTGFFGIKKEEEIASFQEKYLCEPKNANKVQTVSFAVENGQQLVQFIQKQNPKLIVNKQIDKLNEIQESVQLQVNEAEKQALNKIVQQYLIGQFQNTAQGNGTDAQNQQKVQQYGYQQNVANAQQLQVQPQQQQTFVNFQSQLPNQFNQYSYNQFTKYQQQGPLQANVAMAPVQQFNQNQNANVVLQARPMTPQGQNPIMQQQVPQYAENQGQSIQQRPVSRGQPNYALENQQYVQNQPQVNAVFNQGRPMSPANQQFAQNPVLQNNVNRPMTPQSQVNQLLYQQQVQNYQQQNYNQFQQQNPAAFPQNRPQTPSYQPTQQYNQINQVQYQQDQFQPQYQQNNAQTFQQPQTQNINQPPQQIPNSNQMNQNQIPANMDLQQQIVQYAQMQTAPFQQSAEQQKVIQQALFQQQFQNSEVPVLQLNAKNE
ncbi:Hypothetical_protein [Hexamita inflata]|uniref:Hypothetical_protein n=1 Tax=Hexamita inflata TaxID=28002 RepID=A0AA86NDF4_9EUKA|nr:Hypothetical protein HINF_LOCUS4916 [Hexamita inflata]